MANILGFTSQISKALVPGSVDMRVTSEPELFKDEFLHMRAFRQAGRLPLEPASLHRAFSLQ